MISPINLKNPVKTPTQKPDAWWPHSLVTQKVMVSFVPVSDSSASSKDKDNKAENI